MITFQVEPYLKVRDEAQRITVQHFEEIALFKDKMVLSPDFSRYEDLDKAGKLCFITVREGGKLIGYHVSFVVPHLHYKEVLVGATDIFYIEREHRKGTAGIRLFKFFEEEMKRRGVQEIFAGCKVKLNLDSLFSYLGWQMTDHMFAKWIGE